MSNKNVFPLQQIEVEVLNSEYGKNLVKFLYVRREGKKHSIKEVEVCAHIRLNDVKEYFHGNNKDVVPTDTIKNVIYAIAKQKGVNIYLTNLLYYTLLF